MNYLIHGYNKRKLGLVHNAAGIQHVGHEGHWIYAARCVHYVHHDGWEGRGLKHVTTHWIWINMYCGINDNNDNGNLTSIDFI